MILAEREATCWGSRKHRLKGASVCVTESLLCRVRQHCSDVSHCDHYNTLSCLQFIKWNIEVNEDPNWIHKVLESRAWLFT